MNWMIAAFLFLASSAQASDVMIKISEEGRSGPKDLRLPLQSKESVFTRGPWKCGVIRIGQGWGIFHCDRNAGMEVGTRFDCSKQKSFEESRMFHISKYKEINATFSIWCE